MACHRNQFVTSNQELTQAPFDLVMKQMVLSIIQVLTPLSSQHFEEKERKKSAMHFEQVQGCTLSEKYSRVMHTSRFDIEDTLNTKVACKH